MPTPRREEVTITVVHEIAHHFGIDDARLHEARLGLTLVGLTRLGGQAPAGSRECLGGARGCLRRRDWPTRSGCSREDAPEPVEGVEEDFGADEAPEEGFEVLASLPAFGAASESALSFCHSG